jgi:hypothetical protein
MIVPWRWSFNRHGKPVTNRSNCLLGSPIVHIWVSRSDLGSRGYVRIENSKQFFSRFYLIFVTYQADAVFLFKPPAVPRQSRPHGGPHAWRFQRSRSRPELILSHAYSPDL